MDEYSMICADAAGQAEHEVLGDWIKSNNKIIAELEALYDEETIDVIKQVIEKNSIGF